MDDRLLELVAELGDPERRASAAQRLAARMGGEALLLLVRDAELDTFLPAPGLPQTLPGGPSWRRLLAALRAGVVTKGCVAWPDRAVLRPATAVACERGLAAVLIGGSLVDGAVGHLRRVLPLIAATLRAEQAATAALGASAVAREQAQQSQSLTLALETARRELERSLDESARLNRELQQADRLKNEFLATLAHELRNPLAALQGALYLGRTKISAEHPASHATTVAVRQADRLARLVDDLIDVSRITHGKIDLQTEPLNVDDVLARSVESVRPHLETRGHDLVVRASERPSWIAADSLRAEQIFTNLLTNAIKYTNPGGRIEIVAYRMRSGPRELVRVTVADNGIGIAAGMLPKVFDLFRQADDAPERSQGGLGIGLTLVRRLVEMQGGTVSVSSAGLGKGTEVSVEFPAVNPPIPKAQVPRHQYAASAGRRRVLIVDDNDDAAQMTAEIVTLWGHETRVVNDAASALADSELFRPHVILLDIGLPDMSGYEVASRIKQRQVARAPILVALTGYGQPEDRRRTAEAGFDHHFVKPIDVVALQELLAANDRPSENVSR